MNAIGTGHEARSLVGGHWRAEGVRRDICNPARTDEVVGQMVESTPEEVCAAIEAAAAAGPAWARTSLAERCAMLRAVTDGVAERSVAEDWPSLLTREQGKILPESELDVAFIMLLTDYCLSVAEEVFAEERLEDWKGRRIRHFGPIGVVSAITPWNWPVTLSALKLIPALLCGNTVVLKPAPTTPLTVTRLIDVMASVLPPGVVNLVHGGGEVGSILTQHPAVRKVSFTGSIGTGRTVMRNASESIKNVTLELGGNDPAILLDDVVVDEDLAEALVSAAFATSGQVCIAIKRLYVHESRYHEVVDAVREAVDRLVVGDGLDERSTTGPLNNRTQFERVRSLIADAERSGAKVQTLGQVIAPESMSAGFYVRPAIVTDIADEAPLVAEEQFGPVLPILPYGSEEEVVARANATEYGLAGSVWSQDEDRAFVVARQLEAGAVFVNAHGLTAFDMTCPGGGIKQSGLGLELGIDGIRSYTESAYVTNRIQ